MAKKNEEEIKLAKRKEAQKRAETNLDRVKYEIKRRFVNGAVITPQKRNSISKILTILRNMDNEDSIHLIQTMSPNLNKALTFINNVCIKRRNASDKAVTAKEVDPLTNIKEGLKEKLFSKFDTQVRDSILKAYNELNEGLDKIQKINSLDALAKEELSFLEAETKKGEKTEADKTDKQKAE